MKKLYLALAVSLFSFNAQAFVVSPHVGLDYVSATPNGYGHIDRMNGVAGSVGVKALGFVSLEAFYQQYFSVDVANKTDSKPKAYGVDAVFDTLNLGVVEVLTTVGYGKYTLDGGTLNKKMKDFEGEAYRAGVGVQFNPTGSIGIRAMYRYVFPDENVFKKNVQEFTIGLRYYFF